MSTSDSNARPHRRLSLTLPTTSNPPIEAEPTPSVAPATSDAPPTSASTDTGNPQDAAPAATVRVMAYLTEDEARLLDEIWFSLRRDPSRPSKSDILRAALAVAAIDRTQLSVMLSEQQHSTLSRQRGSKMRGKTSN